MKAPVSRVVAAAGLASLLAAAGCGTTVPLAQRGSGAQAGSGFDAGLGSGATDSASPSGVIPDAQPAAAHAGTRGGAATGPSGAAAGVGSSQSSTGTFSAGTSGMAGRGVTATTITIGVAVATDTSALGNATGVSGAGTVSEQDMVNAVVKDVNKAGGILGHKLVAYFHTFSAASGVANPEQTSAEICTDFRDDHKVFAAVFDVPLPSLRTCLASMGTPLLILGNTAILPASSYTEHGGSFLYGVSSITAERLAQLFIQSLMTRAFTTKWDTTAGGPGGLAAVRLGLIHADTPDQNALYADYAKELAQYGLKFYDTVTYTADASAALAATQSAVLKFRGDGVTHVFGASAFFLRDAESQQYRPRYAYLPGLGALGADNSPAAQLKGALTVGWSPAADVHAEQDPGVRTAGKRCTAVMRGQGLTAGNRQDLATMFSVCDTLYSLQVALTEGANASVMGLRRGFESLGNQVNTALTFAADLAQGRHSGVNSVRDMAFDTSCSCLKYTSGTDRS